MTAAEAVGSGSGVESEAVWRALANPIRRQLLDSLSAGPRTTGDLAGEVPDLSRFAVMQHLGVLTEAGLVVARSRGRYRFNHLNPVPLRRWYERWVAPLADGVAKEMLALERAVHQTGGEQTVSVAAPAKADEYRTVRIQTELRFRAAPQRVYDVLVERSREWFPATYGEDKVKAIVLEPRVGGAYYEDWGEGRGHLYGIVSAYDPPFQLAYRGRLEMGTILDTEYELEADGEETILRVSKVAVGPISEEDAAGISRYGDISRFQDALRKVVEGE
jgi:DNA-binding transcriptional ArsR family regulator